MESRVEHAHLWDVGQQGSHGIHALDVGRVVEGSQVVAGGKRLHHLRGEQHRLVELLATMHHAVTHGIQFVQMLQHGILTLGEHVENPLHTSSVLSDRLLHLVLLAIQFHGDKRVWQTNLLDAATRDDRLVGHVIQCIFYR